MPSYWFLLTEVLLLSAVTFIFYTWLPQFFHEAYHMNLAQAGFQGTFAAQAGGALGVILGGWLSDIIARKTPRHRLLMQGVCDCASAPLLVIFLFVPSAAVLQVVFFLFSFVRFTGAANTNPVMCDLIQGQHRSLAFGIMNFASCLSAGLGVLLAGMLKGRFGLGLIFACLSSVVLMSGLILLAAYATFHNPDRELAEKT